MADPQRLEAEKKLLWVFDWLGQGEATRGPVTADAVAQRLRLVLEALRTQAAEIERLEKEREMGREAQLGLEGLLEDANRDITQLEAQVARLTAERTNAVDGLITTYQRLVGGEVGKLEDEVDEALHIVEQALERIGINTADLATPSSPRRERE